MGFSCCYRFGSRCACKEGPPVPCRTWRGAKRSFRREELTPYVIARPRRRRRRVRSSRLVLHPGLLAPHRTKANNVLHNDEYRIKYTTNAPNNPNTSVLSFGTSWGRQKGVRAQSSVARASLGAWNILSRSFTPFPTRARAFSSTRAPATGRLTSENAVRNTPELFSRDEERSDIFRTSATHAGVQLVGRKVTQ